MTASSDTPESPEFPTLEDKEERGESSPHNLSSEDSLSDTAMPLTEHLTELRARLLKSLAVLFLAFLLSLYFAQEILTFLLRPLSHAGQNTLIYTQLFEAFIVELKAAFFVACFVTFPFLANQLWQFVAPGLYQRERRVFMPFLIATPILFIAGASFAYFITIPFALEFLLGYQGNLGEVKQEALPSAANYLSFTMQFIMAFGIAFLLPILLMLIERAGIVSYEQLVAARRYMIVAAFAIAAVFTPPDALSQILLAIPLVLLYEISLLAIRITRRSRTPATAESEQKANDS